ncbi:MAG TPA: cupin domain-containing protein [Tetragenococcus sp.]|nr:cupin domain-containing protein [Tetragenococcus sp.]
MLTKAPTKTTLSTLFDSANQPNSHVTMGIITLAPGQKSPAEGFACHQQDEFSYIISGAAHTILANGEDIYAKAGTAQLIEKDEGHINYNDGTVPAVVVWFLVDR